MASPEAPKLTVHLSLYPNIYNYSNPTPPTLSITITSDASHPITLLTYNKPFHPSSGLYQNCFPIWDLTTSTGVPCTTTRTNRGPLSRARGSADEQYFLTLHPNVPTTVSTRFARGNEDVRPLSKDAAQAELEEALRNGKARRSTLACGVDGLEPGHRYRVSVARAPLEAFWWRWGTKEEVLVDTGGREWPVDTAEKEDGALEIGEIEGVEFSVEE